MDAIETLLAIEAIKQLKARYFYTLDTKQWHDYGALFAADAVIDFSSQQALMQQAGTLGIFVRGTPHCWPPGRRSSE